MLYAIVLHYCAVLLYGAMFVFSENRILREAQERMVIVTLLLVQGVSQNLLPHTSIMHHEQPVRWLAVLAGTEHSEH